MILKTLQWNIGGGKIRKVTDAPHLKASYIHDGLSHIVEHIKQLVPDIITLQEVHSDTDLNQLVQLSQQLGYSSYIHNILEKSSHIDSTKAWGLGILSRYPLTESTFKLFKNPLWKGVDLTGTTFDYGAQHAKIYFAEKVVEIVNVHFPPFHHFDKDPFSDDIEFLRDDYLQKLMPQEKTFLIQGDFNANASTIESFLPKIAKISKEVLLKENTTPRGKHLDHILYQGMQCKKSEVIKSALTDHYAIYSEFDL